MGSKDLFTSPQYYYKRRRAQTIAAAFCCFASLHIAICSAQAQTVRLDVDKQGLAHTRPFQARYALSYRGTEVGRTDWQLSFTGRNRYLFIAQSAALGLYAVLKPERVMESSEGSLRGAIASPEHYRHVRTGGKRDRDIEAKFDRSAGSIEHRYNQDRWRAALTANTLDSLSYILALAKGLADGEKRFKFRVVEAQKIKEYQLERRAERDISTPAGTFRAVEVVRLNMRANRKMSIWCAKALGFLPVKVEHTETEGYKVELSLQSISQSS